VTYSGVDTRHDAVRGGRRGHPFGPLRAVLLLGAVALAGGVVDVVTGAGLRLGFAIGLALGSLLAAMLVHRSGLLVVVFTPPLVFLAASMLFVVATGWLVYGFPTMATATGVAVVTAGLRIARGTGAR
jgi:hypothetical protein